MKGAFGAHSMYAQFIPWVLQLLLVATILLVALVIADRRQRPRRFDLFCCWLLLSAFFISPRFFDYDLAVLVVPVVLLGRMLIMQRGVGLGVAVVIACFGTAFLRTPAQFQMMLSEWTGTFVMFGVWLGSAVQWLTAERATSYELGQTADI